MKRTQRMEASRPGDIDLESSPVAALERHSGEGSASALETLQKREVSRRLPAAPADASPEDPAAPGPARQRQP